MEIVWKGCVIFWYLDSSSDLSEFKDMLGERVFAVKLDSLGS